MKLVIEADEGDRLTIDAHQLVGEFGIVRIHIENTVQEPGETDWVTLSVSQARALAWMLIAATDSASLSNEPLQIAASGTAESSPANLAARIN